MKPPEVALRREMTEGLVVPHQAEFPKPRDVARLLGGLVTVHADIDGRRRRVPGFQGGGL